MSVDFSLLNDLVKEAESTYLIARQKAFNKYVRALDDAECARLEAHAAAYWAWQESCK
jgi:hypothetical protein